MLHLQLHIPTVIIDSAGGAVTGHPPAGVAIATLYVALAGFGIAAPYVALAISMILAMIWPSRQPFVTALAETIIRRSRPKHRRRKQRP